MPAASEFAAFPAAAPRIMFPFIAVFV